MTKCQFPSGGGGCFDSHCMSIKPHQSTAVESAATCYSYN